MTRTSRHSFARLALVGLTAAALFSACGTASPSVNTVPASQATPASPAPSVAAHKAVAITVGVLRPGATQEAADALNLQISQFEAKYPWITVNPEEYNWTAPTFTAALAAGTLPDVFTIPFTDGKGLIAQHQIVNLDSRMRALPYVDKFNKNVLVNGQDADGKIWAVPTQAYGMSLTYNRTLFTQAGLDPDKPPTTWDEVKAAARTIADNTGQAGFAEMATENTGGWQLTTATYARGGRVETVGSDGKVTSSVNNAATKDALQYLRTDGRRPCRSHQQINDPLWWSLHIRNARVRARPLKSWPALWRVAHKKWKPPSSFMHRPRCPAAGLRPISGTAPPRSLASACSTMQRAVQQDGLACIRPDKLCCMTRATILYSMVALQRFVVIPETTTAGMRSSRCFAARLRGATERRYSVALSLKSNRVTDDPINSASRRRFHASR